MDGEMLEIGVMMRKVMIFTIRRCFRSVSSHPFLVGLLCFLVFLYRSSPFMFSLLVSASPVLVCTAVLLGTLLSFGQPNIPEIQRDEKITQEIASLKTEVFGDPIVVEKNDSYSLESVTRGRAETVEHLNEEPYSATNRSGELDKGDILNSSSPLIEESYRDLKFETDVIEEGGRELEDLRYAQKYEMDDERHGDRETKIDDEDLEFENDKSPAESFDSERVNVDSLDSPPGSPWKHVVGEEQEEEMEQGEEEDTVDSWSDGAESSSPDASMADIIPMLDELHPLLDQDAPQPASLSHDGSYAASEHSSKSIDRSIESDDNVEKHEEVEVADEDNEDADDEDEVQGSKEGCTKSAITWTEEDQKNLMDLGSSELERNQRLESLIARRRARKTMSMRPERNLIDLEGVDLPFLVPPISTARNNPFDSPRDSYDNIRLPPIPGSAPSILLKRQNPFDLPYDSSEEKPDLMGDSFQQEFTSFQPKEPFFQRHESFNVGPSIFRTSKQDIRLRPYFVPERMDSEGTSYSAFQRQSSGLSESKGSSVPDMDSVVSAGDVEDKNLIEENISHYAVALNSVPEIELSVPDGDLEDNNLSEEDIHEEQEVVLKKEDKNHSEEDIYEETELISKIDHVSEHVGHGSQSSEEVNSELDEVEKRDIEVDIGLVDAENQHAVERIVFEEGGAANLGELNATETHLNAESAKQGYRSASSSSSLSEVSERIFSERETEGVSNLDDTRDEIVEEVGTSRQHALERLDLNTTRAFTGDISQKEPIYDSSPPVVWKDLSSSSMSSDLHVESEMALPPVLVKRTVSFAESDSESRAQGIEKNASENEDISAYSSLPHPLDDQSESRTHVEIRGHPFMKFDLSEADQVTDSRTSPAVLESIVNHDSIGSRSSLDLSIEGDIISQPDSREYLENQISSSVNLDVQTAEHSVLHQTVESVANFSGGQSLAQSKGQLHSQPIDQVLDLNTPSTESQPTVEHSVDKEVAFQPDQRQDPPSNSSTNSDAGVSVEPEEKQISVDNQYASEEKSVSEFDEELVFLDKTIDETSSRDHRDLQEPSVILEEIAEESISGDDLNVSGVQEPLHEASPNINSPTSPESIYIPSYENGAAEGYSDGENNSIDGFENDVQFQAIEARNFSAEATNYQVDVQNIEDVEDDMKEIDEVLLSELDTVGDFSVNGFGSAVNAFEKHVASVGDGTSFPHVSKPSSNAIDDNSIELHEREPIMHSEKPSSSEVVDFDAHGEKVKSVSEPQTSWTRAIEHTVSVGDLIEGEVHSSGDLKPIENQTMPRENEIENANSRVVQNSDRDISTEMHVVEARSIEDIEPIFKKAELASMGTESMLDRSEMPHQGQASEATSSGMNLVEARTLLDIDLAFKQISEKEIEKPIVDEPPHVEEPIAEGPLYQEQHEGSSLTEPKMKLLLEGKLAEDAELVLKQSHEAIIERHTLPGSVEPTTLPGLHAVDPTLPELPVMETRSAEDANVAAKQVAESHQEKVPESSLSVRSAEVEINYAGTSNDMQWSDKETDVKEISESGDEMCMLKLKSQKV